MRRPPCLPTLFLILLAASTPLAAADAPTGRASAALATSATPLVHAVPELPAPPPRVTRERAPSGVTVLVRSTGADGVPPSDADNDFTRINDAMQTLPLLGPGTTIELEGTFDWSEPFARADWELGTDGLPATGDEFVLMPPGGVTDVTVTANPAGAVILGPGELPEQDFEGFLMLWADGGFQGWTISGLDVRDFEWAITMFWSGPVTDFDGVSIVGNRIELPPDLNETAAPADAFQNIALHLSFGVDQTIAGNEIVIPGTGVSDPDTGERAACVALQSNTSGGAVYDGLVIADNLIRITGAQDPAAEWIYGIWENASGHTSNISITGNRFVNEDPGNVATLNRQRAFRVTSHSSATTTVTYSGNEVVGANEGFQWLGDGYVLNPPATVEPIELDSNVLLDNGIGVLVQSGNGNARAALELNRFHGNLLGLVNAQAQSLAENNWWGCNAGPNSGACDAFFEITPGVDADPWLVLGAAVDPATVVPGGISTATADLTLNSDGGDTGPLGAIADDTPVGFAATGGAIDPPAAGTVGGFAAATYTGGAVGGVFEVLVTVDDETVAVPIEVLSPLIFADGFESGDTGAWSATVP